MARFPWGEKAFIAHLSYLSNVFQVINCACKLGDQTRDNQRVVLMVNSDNLPRFDIVQEFIDGDFELPKIPGDCWPGFSEFVFDLNLQKVGQIADEQEFLEGEYGVSSCFQCLNVIIKLWRIILF